MEWTNNSPTHRAVLNDLHLSVFEWKYECGFEIRRDNKLVASGTWTIRNGNVVECIDRVKRMAE
jgi:hypothetical protein